jgi:hypothetical protein
MFVVKGALEATVSWRQLRQPAPAGQVAVTQADLEKVQMAVANLVPKSDFSKLENALSKMEQALASGIQRSDDYAHRQTHELRDIISPLSNRLTVVEQRQLSMETQFTRVIGIVDKNNERMAELVALIRLNLGLKASASDPHEGPLIP